MEYDNATLQYVMEGLDDSCLDLLTEILDFGIPVTYKQLRTEIRPNWSQSTVDKHIQRLLGARFIKEFRKNNNRKFLYYEINQNGLKALSLRSKLEEE